MVIVIFCFFSSCMLFMARFFIFVLDVERMSWFNKVVFLWLMWVMIVMFCVDDDVVDVCCFYDCV